jgi:hypothetical protein
MSPHEEYLTQEECSAVQHASELRTAICEIVDSSCQSTFRYTMVMEENHVAYRCVAMICINNSIAVSTQLTSLDNTVNVPN